MLLLINGQTRNKKNAEAMFLQGLLINFHSFNKYRKAGAHLGQHSFSSPLLWVGHNS